MEDLSPDERDESMPNPDFTAGPFVTRREPVKELIHTLSELYINSEEDDSIADADPQPCSTTPLPPDEREEADLNLSLQAAIEELKGRVANLEKCSADCIQKVSQCCSQADLDVQCGSLEEKLAYHIERECDRVKRILELSIQDLGKSMVDCLKRRDQQINNKLRSWVPVTSTPVATPAPEQYTTISRQGVRKTHASQHLSVNTETVPAPTYLPPVKVEFPHFGSEADTDPVSFIERCEEYLAIRPLNDSEILASLTSVLKGTAKDWWLAEKRTVLTWQQFKAIFLRSFLNDDYEAEAERRLLERKQGAKESIRDFAFHYRALCLRWKKDMSEREMVQAILRNCNPRLASLLRGTVRDVSELVRIGTQIERDFEESKRYWSHANSEMQKKGSPSEKDTIHRSTHANTRVVQSVSFPSQSELKMVTLPILLRGRYFQAMVDTGSTLSLIQESCYNQLKGQDQWNPSKGQTFMLANGQMHSSIGMTNWECELQGQKLKLTLYVLRNSDLTVPIILGMDFLTSAGIMLDFRRAQYGIVSQEESESEKFPLLPSKSFTNYLVSFYFALPGGEVSPEVSSAVQQLAFKADTTSEFQCHLEKLMSEWPMVCTNEVGHSSVIKHCINTIDEVPLRKRAYHVSVEKQQFIDKEIKEMLANNIIRPSNSPWASPVVIVPKKDGGSRFCVDFRGLNSKTYLDAYPMPQIQDILGSLHGARIFSTLDLKSGYWQVELEPESIPKTAFVTSSGLFEFLRLPFGLKNAAASFQRLMECVLREIKGKCCFVYIDDIVVYSKDENEHLLHLSQVFSCLNQAGLTLNLKKCNMMQRSLTFLGHVISEEGIKTDPAKIASVSQFPVPQSLKEVQRFLGLAGWYHRFVPRFSEKAAPLHALKKKGATWAWTESCQEAFETIKNDLTQTPVLISPDFSRPFKVQTDASEKGLGAVLTQDIEGEEHVIAYASRLLQGAEKAYSVSEKECCAVLWAVEKWRPYLEGRPFEVITDHAALTWVFNHPKPSSRLTRWAIRLQEFEFTVKYRKGQCNVVPDTLSRSLEDTANVNMVRQVKTAGSTVTPSNLPVDWEEIAKAQQEDAVVKELTDKALAQTDIDPSRIHYVVRNGFLFRSVPDGQKGQKFQLVVPEGLRKEFLKYAHDNPLSGHFGRLKTLLRLLDMVYWPSLRSDVWKHCKECQVCQTYKPSISKLSGYLQNTPVVEPGYMMGVDLMGPFPKSPRQNEYLLVIVDYCSKWVELFPLRVAKAPQIAHILVDEIFTRWGTPVYLVSDRGAQFTSHLLNLVCKQWGVTQKLTTASHPQTNLTERINRTLKTMIASYVNEHHRHWDRWLAEFRFAINTAWQESTRFTPAEIALGRKLKGPVERALSSPPDPSNPAYAVLERYENLLKSVRENVEQAQKRQGRYYNLRRKHAQYQVGELVWVRSHPLSRASEGFMSKLAAKWKGPAKILKCLGPVNCSVAFLDDPSHPDTFHVQNLKPYHGYVKPSNEGKGM